MPLAGVSVSHQEQKGEKEKLQLLSTSISHGVVNIGKISYVCTKHTNLFPFFYFLNNTGNMIFLAFTLSQVL